MLQKYINANSLDQSNYFVTIQKNLSNYIINVKYFDTNELIN